MKKDPTQPPPENPADKLLTLRELSTYMQMNERTVLKLAAAGTLPGARIGAEWRFKREVIDAWLGERMGSGGDPEEMAIDEVPDGAGMPLADILIERSIVADLEAKDKVSAIEALAARAASNGWLFDKAWFVGAVVAREALASTAMEGGVAFLHTRERNSAKITQPFIVFGRSHHGVDFGAPDGKPTHLFFLLGLKHNRLHLPILGRLARLLKRPELVRTLRAAPTVVRLRDTLVQEDVRLIASETEHAAAKKPAAKRPAKPKK